MFLISQFHIITNLHHYYSQFHQNYTQATEAMYVAFKNRKIIIK